MLQQTQPFVAHRAGRSVHMDAAQAQRDLGVPLAHLRQALARFNAKGRQTPVPESVLRLPESQARPVPVRQWEAERQNLLAVYLEFYP